MWGKISDVVLRVQTFLAPYLVPSEILRKDTWELYEGYTDWDNEKKCILQK